MRPGECYVIDGDGMRRIQDDYALTEAYSTAGVYPTPPEPHSAADLLRPLATDNARLRDDVDRLTVMNEVLRIALRRALEREAALGRVPG